jgi:WD40 repeat protein
LRYKGLITRIIRSKECRPYIIEPNSVGYNLKRGAKEVRDNDTHCIAVLGCIPFRHEFSFCRHDHRVSCLAFNTDGSRLFSGSWDKYIKVWDAASGELVDTLVKHETQVIESALSPDGTRMVTASSDSTLKIWDTATGKLALVLRGHESRVSSVAFTPDGRRIVSGSHDNTVRIWNALPRD